MRWQYYVSSCTLTRAQTARALPFALLIELHVFQIELHVELHAFQVVMHINSRSSLDRTAP